MSYCICIVFVALAIFRGAIANDAAQPGIINVEIAKMESPANDLFKGERADTGFIGDITVGQRSPGDVFYGGAYNITNSQSYVVERDLKLALDNDKPGIIRYFDGTTVSGDRIVFCATPTTLGSITTLVKLRIPPNAKSVISCHLATDQPIDGVHSEKEIQR